jgi:hypothetical protein
MCRSSPLPPLDKGGKGTEGEGTACAKDRGQVRVWHVCGIIFTLGQESRAHRRKKGEETRPEIVKKLELM